MEKSFHLINTSIILLTNIIDEDRLLKRVFLETRSKFMSKARAQAQKIDDQSKPHQYTDRPVVNYFLLCYLYYFSELKQNFCLVYYYFTVVDTIQGAFRFLEAKKMLRRKYLYGENEPAANFHVMWFIYLLFLSLLRYPSIYISPLVVRVLRHILSLTMGNYLMNE